MPDIPEKMSGRATIRAVLTDVQFWIPAIVFLAGIALLILLC